MKCNDRVQCDTKQFELAGVCRAQDPMGCRLTGSTETLCLFDFCNFGDVDWCDLA